MTANWQGSPRTWSDGAVTAADFNTEVRDRFDWVRDVLLLHGMDSATTPGRLAGAKYGCHVNASQGINDAADSVINWDNEDWDSGFWSASPSPGRITVPSGGGGLYLYILAGSYAADADNYRGLWLEKNGATILQRANASALGAAWDTTLRVMDLVMLSDTDYLQALTRHSANNNLTIDATLALIRLARV